MHVRTSVRELSLGSVAIIVGYDKAYGGYIGKLIALGLTPGKKLIVLEHFTQEKTIAILLSEKVIHLSKPQADALCVEEIKEEET